MNRRGNNRGVQVVTARTVKREVNALKSSLHGHANKLRHMAPPGFNKRPFNNLVVSHVQQTPNVEEFYGPEDVVQFIKNQLGLQDQTKTKIVFKLKRIDFYAVPIGSSTDRPSITMNISSLIPTVGDPATPGNAIVGYGNLYSKNDIGSLQDCAKLSYTFPRAMADIPMGQTADFNFMTCSSNVANSEIRFHLEWSTISEATPTE